ncbi:Nitrogen assimilation regulatory protein [Polystyrenella longa]|uniref:DNA-binding transcriptional regulator NtrC n=1 Tax=Polystyrenella longa TaxID=2528007 RepID=A0A518CTM6_9PLAN|nr:sigma-54 dependent transcriptional regulator [Polystyrenella longa]QDU82576.1 Nitrogen assimilation regulatory protein [Polystyrenella longa]
MPKLLVIDDEPSILHAFKRAFDDPDIELLTAETAAEGEAMVAVEHPDVVVLDLRLPDKSGLECFNQIREIDPRTPVIFITGHGTVETAIEATKLGAYDYLFKPLELDQLKALIDKAFHLSHMIKVQPVVPGNDSEAGTRESIVGRCDAMKEVYKAIGQVAVQDLSVLLLGESGTGKEVIAQAIYHHSNRVNKSFHTINCAAIPESLLESEMFGHEKGSFTSADRRRIGKFEQADGGTLFLDEVGDMSPMTQAKLLRVLQDGTFERVGGSGIIKADVRVIAATNHDLQHLVAEVKFRKDLFYRLSVVTIHLPPLREREGDLRLLAEHFLHYYGPDFGRKITQISQESLKLLQDYSWPGNVRELESVIKQSLLKARGTVLLPEFLPPLTEGGQQAQNSSMESDLDTFIEQRLELGSTELYSETIACAERHLLQRVLKQTKGNQVQASAILGISRVTLRNRIRSLDIKIDKFT